MTKQHFTSRLRSAYKVVDLIDSDPLDSVGKLFPAQKSSISCVSAIPPINEPASCRRGTTWKASTAMPSAGRPTCRIASAACRDCSDVNNEIPELKLNS
jgi:hypothetical protein